MESADGHRYVRVIHRRTIACSAEQAIEAVQDIKAIEQTEVKADRVEVFPESKTTGTYEVTGHFAKVPWRSRFAYRLHDGGFHSHKVEGEIPRSWEISGGFVVAPLDDGKSLIVHYEDYGLPRYLAPLRGLIRLYLRRSMEVELRALERLLDRR